MTRRIPVLDSSFPQPDKWQQFSLWSLIEMAQRRGVHIPGDIDPQSVCEERRRIWRRQLGALLDRAADRAAEAENS
jgi:hypothetical protein